MDFTGRKNIVTNCMAKRTCRTGGPHRFAASIQSSATLVADLSAEQKRLTSELEAMIKSIKEAIEDGS